MEAALNKRGVACYNCPVQSWRILFYATLKPNKRCDEQE